MRVASLAFFRPEAAAEHRLNTERIEIIRRNDSTRSTFRAIADAERCARDSIDNERLEKSCVFLEIEKIGIGKPFLFRSSLSGTKERDHSVLMRDQRVGANQNPLDPTEDRGVGSDPERETKNRENGKTRAAHEHARAEANVLQKFIRPRPDSLRARDFFRLLDTAELSQGGIARFVRRLSPGNVSFDQKIDMRLHLFRHLRVATALLK